MSGQPIQVHDDGSQTRDFIYVDSVTNVLLDALERCMTVDSLVNLAISNRVILLEIRALM